METHLSYFEDTYKFDEHATIMATDKDENGHFLVLNQTIFYPQGGGQPSDQGTFQVGSVLIPIHHVRLINQRVRHYTDQSYSHLVRQTGVCTLDQDLRLLHAKLHTSGHLISNVVESHYPHWRAIKGHHFPGESYVEFTAKNGSVENIALEWLNKEIAQHIEKDDPISMDQISGDKIQELSYSIPKDQPLRVIRIGEFPFSPCGGTHVKSLLELAGLKITKYKIKKNTMKIYYEIDIFYEIDNY